MTFWNNLFFFSQITPIIFLVITIAKFHFFSSEKKSCSHLSPHVFTYLANCKSLILWLNKKEFTRFCCVLLKKFLDWLNVLQTVFLHIWNPVVCDISLLEYFPVDTNFEIFSSHLWVARLLVCFFSMFVF